MVYLSRCTGVQCPLCQCDKAYVGFTEVWCVNPECANYNPKHASDMGLDEDPEPEGYDEEELWLQIWRGSAD